MQNIGSLAVVWTGFATTVKKLNHWAAVAVVLLVSACVDEPRLQADTEANFDRTFLAMSNSLNDPDKIKLESSLKDIVLIQAGLYGDMPNSKSSPILSRLRPMNGPAKSEFEFAMRQTLDAGISSLWEKHRARAVVQNAGGKVHGRSAKEIFIIAEAERRSSNETILKLYEELLAKARIDFAELNEEKERLLRKQSDERTLLERVEINKARFGYSTTGFLDTPTIKFVINNKGALTVKRIFLTGKVQTPGRSVPWVEQAFNYEFPGGLEPKETKELNLSLNMFSKWADVPRDVAQGTITSLKLTSFEDAAGKRVGAQDAADETLDARQKALDEGIRQIEIRIGSIKSKQI